LGISHIVVPKETEEAEDAQSPTPPASTDDGRNIQNKH
jgi:hypothetical protein